MCKRQATSPRLTKRDRDLLDDFAVAAQDWGWQQDQGLGTAVARAEAEYERAYKALERRLWQSVTECER